MEIKTLCLASKIATAHIKFRSPYCSTRNNGPLCSDTSQNVEFLDENKQKIVDTYAIVQCILCPAKGLLRAKNYRSILTRERINCRYIFFFFVIFRANGVGCVRVFIRQILINDLFSNLIHFKLTISKSQIQCEITTISIDFDDSKRKKRKFEVTWRDYFLSEISSRCCISHVSQSAMTTEPIGSANMWLKIDSNSI